MMSKDLRDPAKRSMYVYFDSDSDSTFHLMMHVEYGA